MMVKQGTKSKGIPTFWGFYSRGKDVPLEKFSSESSHSQANTLEHNVDEIFNRKFRIYNIY